MQQHRGEKGQGTKEATYPLTELTAKRGMKQPHVALRQMKEQLKDSETLLYQSW
jgi:hypothetical protein